MRSLCCLCVYVSLSIITREQMVNTFPRHQIHVRVARLPNSRGSKIRDSEKRMTADEDQQQITRPDQSTYATIEGLLDAMFSMLI
jgi:hypothetical protein